MKREDKAELVGQLKDQFAHAKAAYLTRFSGLAVKEIDLLRGQIRQAGGSYRVIKNTLARLGTAGTDFEKMAQEQSGALGWAITDGDPVGLAKALKTFKKDREIFQIEQGMVDGELLDSNSIDQLAEMPPKEVLLAQLLGLLNTPARSFLGLLQAVPRQIVTVIDQNRQKKEESNNG